MTLTLAGSSHQGYHVWTMRNAAAMLVLGAIACGPAHRPRYVRKPSLPDALVVRVDRVRVAPLRTGTNQPWDGSAAHETPRTGCKLLGWAAQVGSSMIDGVQIAPSTIGKGVELLCGLADDEAQPERDARNPDLRLRLSTPGARFESTTLRDTLSGTFQYAFVVPSRAIPPEGLLLEVLDDDETPGPESIGSVRLNSALLRRASAAAGNVLELRQGGVSQLEVVVTAYVPLSLPPTQVQAAQGARTIASRPLAAGEVLHLRASGSYRVGGWYDDTLGPNGYSSNDPQRYNFEQEPFASAPHGCAIALVGGQNTVQGAVVGTSTSFMTFVAGPLRVGLNDIDPKNNRGSLTFSGHTRAPTAEEWLQAR